VARRWCWAIVCTVHTFIRFFVRTAADAAAGRAGSGRECREDEEMADIKLMFPIIV